MIEVAFAESAQADLDGLFDWIAERAGAATAIGYCERLKAFCNGLAHFPERGALRAHLRPGLRVTAFRRSATIAYVVIEERVIILRILARGRSLERAV